MGRKPRVKDEVLTSAKRADDPPEEMPERRDHSRNHIGKVRIELCANSFILQVYDVLARHRIDIHSTCQPVNVWSQRTK